MMPQELLPRFSVIPTRGKIPGIPWLEYQSRKATPEEIAEWQKSFTDFGIVTGPISGVLVLDIDGEKGLREAQALGLPFTPKVKTNKGWHYYFRWVPELEEKVTTKARFSEELDVRGDGGFVVFYGWQTRPSQAQFAPPPRWLLDKLPNKNGDKPKSLGEKIDDIKPGNRNDTLFSLASGLRARGYRGDDIFKLLLPKAREVGTSDSELALLCGSAARYEPRPEFQDAEPESFESFIEYKAELK
jgi:hypothetical protein